jgi:hypothetical protein
MQPSPEISGHKKVAEVTTHRLAYVFTKLYFVRFTTNVRDIILVVFAIFGDSWVFVFVTAVLKHGVGLNSSYGLCSSGIILCLVCYVTTKVCFSPATFSSYDCVPC